MPITEERVNIQDLRAVGFSADQAVVLAAKLEAAAHAAGQDMKSFLIQEFATIRQEIRQEIAALGSRTDFKFAEQEVRFERTLRLHLATLLTAMIGVAGVTLAILKFFPAGH